MLMSFYVPFAVIPGLIAWDGVQSVLETEKRLADSFRQSVKPRRGKPIMDVTELAENEKEE